MYYFQVQSACNHCLATFHARQSLNTLRKRRLTLLPSILWCWCNIQYNCLSYIASFTLLVVPKSFKCTSRQKLFMFSLLNRHTAVVIHATSFSATKSCVVTFNRHHLLFFFVFFLGLKHDQDNSKGT